METIYDLPMVTVISGGLTCNQDMLRLALLSRMQRSHGTWLASRLDPGATETSMAQEDPWNKDGEFITE